jgi:hypothetical protein
MISKKSILAGRIVSGVVVLFLGADAAMKVLKTRLAVEGDARLGYPENTVVGIGVLLLLCTLLYVIPRTSILGAILLTGYLGGAVATHVRVGNPWLGYVLLPVYIGVLVWGSLFLRDPRIRTLLFSK